MRLEVTVQAYCLMPNHVHLILTPPSEAALPAMLQRLHSDYARTLHIHRELVGHLWQARYFSVPMDEAHFWQAMVYVEQNPKRAALIDRCQDWRWSSAAARLSGSEEGLLDLAKWRCEHTTASWAEYLDSGLRDAQMQQRIREATGKGWPLGSENFLEGLAEKLGRPVRPGPRGRKARAAGNSV